MTSYCKSSAPSITQGFSGRLSCLEPTQPFVSVNKTPVR